MAFSPDTLAKGAAARADKALDVPIRTIEGPILTRREIVTRHHAEGRRLECVQVRDETARRAAERVVASMARMSGGWGPPLGNPSHPDTIRYYAAKEAAKNPPMIDEWRHVAPDGRFRVLTVAERDYARTLES